MYASICRYTLLPALFASSLSLATCVAAGQTNPTNNSQSIQTPAEKRYGIPPNPTIGAQPSLDLSQPLTLDRAIQIALQRQNTIAIAAAQRDSSRAQVVAARSSYFPQITPSFQYQTNLTPIESSAFGAGGPTSHSFSSETRTEAIVAKQLIWDGGIREATVQQARNTLFADEYNLGNTRQDVILNVTQSYYALLRDRALVKVQQTNVQLAQTTLESIQEQVRVGNAAPADTLQAQSNLANAKVSLLQAQAVVYDDEAQLKNAMGVVTSQPLVLADQSLPQPDPTPDPHSVDYYTQLAYQNRLDIKQQQAAIDAQTDLLRIARLQAGINVNASVTEGYQFDPVSGEERVFSVSLSYPLFDAGLSRSKVRENEALLTQLERQLDLIEQNIRLNIEQDYRNREVARQQVVAADAAVQAGQTNYDAALAKQQNGLINVLDVINAQLQLVTAQQQQVNALYSYYIANARLLRDIGMNDPEWHPDVPAAVQKQFSANATPSEATDKQQAASLLRDPLLDARRP
ncbi:outer membrane protein [Chthonomonas calidirosea]|uniref:Outer membrane protein n=2 Tax=Chthonomonas TaxID=1077265 RepID=S0EY81_CHTCT|nr:TolC family protein [Chthonomonas calidirosea]CCW35275.1 Outer membrane protein [Chthonomonas calidirosea T49]CEK19775.1 outer membrane protein [Chthonomonas calidirosea]CEK19779.1 outer membrane protein [Chthonomonas calidirosea]CEK20708.1 outer membrane protein [Chthonomonas calidirosea]